MRSKTIPQLGLEGPNCALLSRLHRAFQGPFNLAEATEALGLPRSRIRRLLSYLAARGWLSRVRRGLYITVPLEAEEPGTWLADPWVAASRSFAPCYIGGWTALHHWDLTEQLTRTVVVFTATAVRQKEESIQGTPIRLRQISKHRMFGTRTVWRGKVAVEVSDPERTLIDVLDRPAVGGGIRHVADCLEEWLDSEERRPQMLIEYAERHGNRSIFKRLGYLLEARELGEPDLISACAERMSTGLSPLDMSSSSRGRVLKRWRLRVNARV